jgi:hypothetical protein
MARRGNNAAGGILALIVAIGYGLVMFWYITIPVLVIWAIWYAAKKKPTPTVSVPSPVEPKWREPYTPTYTPKRRRSYKPRKPRVSKPKPDPHDITFD